MYSYSSINPNHGPKWARFRSDLCQEQLVLTSFKSSPTFARLVMLHSIVLFSTFLRFERAWFHERAKTRLISPYLEQRGLSSTPFTILIGMALLGWKLENLAF